MSQSAPLRSLIDLSGKVALVTGAAQGFGRASAERLSEAGADVVLVDLRAAAIEGLASGLAKIGRGALALAGDVTEPDCASRSVAAAVDRFGRLDILVNNAGIFSNRLLAALTLAELRRVNAVNFEAVFLFTKAAVEQFRRQGSGGAVVNISSIDAIHPTVPGLPHYDASKGAVWAFTKNIALELGPEGIRVNSLAPGPARTEGVQEEIAAGAPGGIDMEAQWDSLAAHVPMGRLADSDDIARAVVFLSSDLSSFVTGVQLIVDGGYLLR